MTRFHLRSPEGDVEVPMEILQHTKNLTEATRRLSESTTDFLGRIVPNLKVNCQTAMPILEEYNDAYILTVAVAFEFVLEVEQ